MRASCIVLSEEVVAVVVVVLLLVNADDVPLPKRRGVGTERRAVVLPR